MTAGDRAPHAPAPHDHAGHDRAPCGASLDRGTHEHAVDHAVEPAEATTEVALVMIDLAGFTATTETHGDGVAADIALLLADTTHDLRGPRDRVVKTIGDAVLCASPTPDEAMRWAARTLIELNSIHQLPATRVGANHGPVIERRGDLFGAAVNLTARLAGTADPGTVALTSPMAAAAIRAGFTARGTDQVRLKNIAAPVEVHLFDFDCDACDPRWPVDPVCRMRIDPSRAARTLVGAAGETVVFCSDLCHDTYRDRTPTG